MAATELSRAPSFLANGGDAGALMRSLDWTKSPLGPPEHWPQSLKSVVGLLLGSKFPMVVAWGSQLGFLYNDAYAEILGDKHPAAMGARFQDIWAEVWTEIWPFIEAALAGQATYRTDLPLVLNRHRFEEQTWFTFSYSPVRDDAGEVAGMFCAVMETTERVRAEQSRAFLFELDDRLRDLNDASEIMGVSAHRLAHHLQADRAHWAQIDERAGLFHVHHEWAAEGVSSLIGGHPLNGFGAMDLLRHELTSASIQREFKGDVRGGVYAPLFRNGVWQAALCVHALKPRHWREDEIELVHEVAERVWARVERAEAEARVRQSERRLRALVTATADVIYRMSPDWTEMRSLEGGGFLSDTDSPSIDWVSEYLFPEDQPAIRAVIEEAIRTKGVFQLEHRVRRLDGSTGWTLSRAVPVLDDHGQIIEWFGVATDITEAKNARQVLEKNAEQLRLATEAAEVGFWDFDVIANRFDSAARVKRMFGKSPDSPATMDDIEAVHPEDRERVAAAFAAAMDPDQRALFDEEFRTIGLEDGVLRWVAQKGRGIFNDQGQCVRVVGTAIDVTVRKTVEEHLRLMVNELNHRVKNSLAIVQAITNQTLRRAEIPAEVRNTLASRLVALAAAHDVLTEEKWSGADLADLVSQAAAPYLGLHGASPFVFEGPPVFLPPRTAIAIALAFHELATNAAKYGALSTPGGQVSVTWSQSPAPDGRRLHLTWREQGGPPVHKPRKTGFGTRLIERALAAELQGPVELQYLEQGLVCTMNARLPEPQGEAWRIDLKLT